MRGGFHTSGSLGAPPGQAHQLPGNSEPLRNMHQHLMALHPPAARDDLTHLRLRVNRAVKSHGGRIHRRQAMMIA